MGGLAYMTGPPGRPLRAGASVIDVTGGMFGVIGILAALERRHRNGRGAHVKCSLFETTAFLVGQHMAQMAVTGRPAAPMPARISAWAIYDIFQAAGGRAALYRRRQRRAVARVLRRVRADRIRSRPALLRATMTGLRSGRVFCRRYAALLGGYSRARAARAARRDRRARHQDRAARGPI